MTYAGSAIQGTMYWIEERQVSVYSYGNYRLCEFSRADLTSDLRAERAVRVFFVVDFKLFK